MGDAERRWAEALAAWEIPEEIRSQATADPWKLTPNLFPPPEADDTPADTVTRRWELEALGGEGTVLDVGVGGGAASIPLVPPATRITAVDEREEMLKAFSERAKERGIRHRTFLGRWPDHARGVPPEDLVLTHHTFYNVPELTALALALTAHARRLVVVELTAAHPLIGTNPLWRHFWDLDRPEGPTAEDAIAVLEEAGLDVVVEREERPARRPVLHADRVAFLTRRLCLPPEREPDVEEALKVTPEPPVREVVTLKWEGRATA